MTISKNYGTALKKNMISLLIAAAGMTLSAAELDISGNFARLQTSGFPHDWYLNGSAGYKPAPKFDSAAGNGARILHFSEIKGKSGFGVSSRKPFACIAGNKVVVTAKVKGSGAAWFGLQTFQKDKKWSGILPAKSVILGKEFQEIKVELPVQDIRDRKTASAILTFGASRNADLYISDLRAELVETQDLKN